MMSADLLARLSAMVLRKADFPPMEVMSALVSMYPVAVRPGAKPPAIVSGPGATALPSLSEMSVDKQGILTIRPKIMAVPNLKRFQSLAAAQPNSPSTFGQAGPSYRNKSDSIVLSSSTLPAQKVVKRVAAVVPSQRVVLEALEELGGRVLTVSTSRGGFSLSFCQ